ncbi:hypothetical protein [Pseudomonas japonica]|uniref:hypothetical protein n=1 Tax=Pseudomonas japonica TaxID=256466 RepID=UPI0015E43EE2|nr:hypothetical protein [Pseudomonas japonica]MBA1290569.1 hypothetical protein [Pseudomonas japonica]
MLPTPQQLKILAQIDSGLSAVNGIEGVHIEALIAQGLVSGVRLGYSDLRLTPEGRDVLSQAGAPTNQASSKPYNRRRSDQR